MNQANIVNTEVYSKSRISCGFRRTMDHRGVAGQAPSGKRSAHGDPSVRSTDTIRSKKQAIHPITDRKAVVPQPRRKMLGPRNSAFLLSVSQVPERKGVRRTAREPPATRG